MTENGNEQLEAALSQCSQYRCEAGTLPHMATCHTHTPRYEIPPYDEIECPECGAGEPETIHDNLYYCKNDDCEGLFDPRRFPGEPR